MIRAILPIRSDPAGDGHFGAPRGVRTHNGIDFACLPGSEIMAPITGEITKIGYPYGSGFGGATPNGREDAYRYVQITDEKTGLHHRVFYVEPTMQIGDRVAAMYTIIGKAQDVTLRYPGRGMTPHVHYEIMRNRNEYLDPSAS